MVRRWAQERLGYDFAVFHRPNKMMADVDALNMRFGKLTPTHVSVASTLKDRDMQRRPDAYHHNIFII